METFLKKKELGGEANIAEEHGDGGESLTMYRGVCRI